jgi:hypothetical protein
MVVVAQICRSLESVIEWVFVRTFDFESVSRCTIR